MGAYSQVLAFDFDRHRQIIVPALRQLLDQGVLSEELQPLVTKYSCRYSQSMEVLKSGLGIDLVSMCHMLDQDLGVAHHSVVDLSEVKPNIKGGCNSDRCVAKDVCPFNWVYQVKINAELVMGLFQKIIKTSCLNIPSPLILGKHFQFYELGWWYGNEAGLEYEEASKFFLESKDELTLLLARLTCRGGIWGWGDGGYGEGLLGWLTPGEGLNLASLLDNYDFSAQAPIPEGLSDNYLREEVFPAMRLIMAQLRDYVRQCGIQNLGILLERH